MIEHILQAYFTYNCVDLINQESVNNTTQGRYLPLSVFHVVISSFLAKLLGSLTNRLCSDDVNKYRLKIWHIHVLFRPNITCYGDLWTFRFDKLENYELIFSSLCWRNKPRDFWEIQVISWHFEITYKLNAGKILRF